MTRTAHRFPDRTERREPLQVRRALALDAGPMATLLRALEAGRAAVPDLAVALRDWIAAGDAIWHVAERDGPLLGFQRIGPAPDLPPGGCGIATFTAPGRDGLAVGSALFEATRAAARSRGWTRIEAQVPAGNESALAYYRSRGFEVVAPRDAHASIHLLYRP